MKKKANPLVELVANLLGKLGSTAITQGMKRKPYVRIIKAVAAGIVLIIIVLAIIFADLSPEQIEALEKLNN